MMFTSPSKREVDVSIVIESLHRKDKMVKNRLYNAIMGLGLTDRFHKKVSPTICNGLMEIIIGHYDAWELTSMINYKPTLRWEARLCQSRFYDMLANGKKVEGG